MSNRKTLYYLALLFITLFSVLQLPIYAKADYKSKIVNIGLIFYNPEVKRSEEIINWVSQFNFNKWNFICEAGLTRNQTLIDFFRSHGNIVGLPTIPFNQGIVPPQERTERFDSMYNSFLSVGIKLDGFFLFQADTLTLNRAYDKGMSFYAGYCFEQYAIDHMTMRGGWQLPYYHSHEHALKPAKDNKGLVVFPHLTWDWISSLTVSHELNTHILNAYDICDRNQTRTLEYVKGLIDANLNMVEPFGYATVMFEWDWLMSLGLGDFAANFLRMLIDEYSSYAQTYQETTEWFRAKYLKTPTYHFKFESNFDGQQIEWYYDLNCRIAKVGNKIKSYIEFQGQIDVWRNHYWLVEEENINPNDPANCADYSLSFLIDDLGGGNFRSVAKGGSVAYDRDLESFPVYLRFTTNIGRILGRPVTNLTWQ